MSGRTVVFRALKRTSSLERLTIIYEFLPTSPLFLKVMFLYFTLVKFTVEKWSYRGITGVFRGTKTFRKHS